MYCPVAMCVTSKADPEAASPGPGAQASEQETDLRTSQDDLLQGVAAVEVRIRQAIAIAH